MNLTLGQVRRHIQHFLGVDVRPVKVIVGVLLVITLGETLVKRAAPWKKKEQRHNIC